MKFHPDICTRGQNLFSDIEKGHNSFYMAITISMKCPTLFYFRKDKKTISFFFFFCPLNFPKVLRVNIHHWYVLKHEMSASYAYRTNDKFNLSQRKKVNLS